MKMFNREIFTILSCILCISLTIGCGGHPEPPQPPEYKWVLKYAPVDIKYTGSQAEKWMRDHGYTIRKDTEYYHIIRKDSSNDGNNVNVVDLSTKISVGATVMLPLYDKYVQSVGSLNIMEGAISIEITREGKLVRVLTTK